MLGREDHAAACKGLFQLLDDRGDDRFLLTNKFATSLERGHVERPHRHRAVVEHVFRTVEIEKDDLALEVADGRINQPHARQLDRGGFSFSDTSDVSGEFG